MKNSLRYYRQKAGFTQETLAEKTNLGASTIGNVETGKTQASEDFWAKMENALRVPSEQLRAPLIVTPSYPQKTVYGNPRSEDQVGSARVMEEPPETINWEQRARTAEAKLAAIEALLRQR